MSDVALLTDRPFPWDYQGRTLQVGIPDLELELIFQAVHEAWARNRLEATRSRVSAEVYAADAARHTEAVAANRFAFGSQLSLRWLLSDVGMVEYLALLLAKGGTPVGSAFLAKIARTDRPAFDRLTEEVLRRDFPLLLAPDTSAPAPATP